MPRPPGLPPAGSTIRDRRRQQGLTAPDLAERVGISPKHLNNIERGAVRTAFEPLVRIARELNCPVEDLIEHGDSSCPNQTQQPA